VRVAGPLARYRRGFRLELERRGYPPSSAAARLEVMAALSTWMAAEGVSPGGLSADRVEGFVEFRRRVGYRDSVRPRGLALLVAYLRGIGVVPEPPVVGASPVAPVDLLIDRYRAYLVAERGLAADTVRYYERFARLLFSRLAAPDSGLDLERVTSGEVGRILLRECASRNVGSAKNLVVAWRSVLRFLHVEGLTGGDLTGAVVAVAPPARSLPRSLAAGVVAQLLASCDRRAGSGRRDFAVLMVLARLGLRAGEVARIELADIDWREGELLVRGKGGRRDWLPLPHDVGEALAGYVRRGRPRVVCERLFMRVNAPIGPLSSSGVSNVVRAACRRCGLPVVCAHRLRHTLATETLRAGGSLDEIGQLLRQSSAFTTAIYARVDRPALRELARPWPGGRA
jgi:integrase/recombinase XerD